MKNRFFYLHKGFLALMTSLVLIGCTNDDTESSLTAEQQGLIGRAVNFDVSMADGYKTRSIYNDDGSFSDNDLMRIYRQYANDNGTWKATQSYRTYQYKPLYANGTEVLLNQNWKVEKDRYGYNDVADAKHGTGEFVQASSDSLTWENGSTVRFRAWSRSNYYNSITGNNGKNRYYPDFCIADYVNASGPTQGIPLLLKHVGCRIVFMRRLNGNEFYKIEVCTDWEDYKRTDNNTDHAADDHEFEAGKTDAKAQEECNAVLAVYNKMCMPAGVNISDGTLLAMPKTYWENATATQIRYLENDEAQFFKYGEKTPDKIASDAQRPIFNHLNGSVYLITIPYDMSDEPTTQGNVLVLPPCTRFRVYLTDVNNGDQYGTGGYEGTYHILTLSDIKNKSGDKIYTEGMELIPGNSYGFYVGYKYNQLTVTAEDNFSWTEQDIAEKHQMKDEQEVPVMSGTYGWWKNAIRLAIPKGMEDFEPKFHITNREEFLEFIKLVNGTATDKTTTDPLRSVARYKKIDGVTTKTYDWFKQNEITPGFGGKNDTIFYTQTQLEQEGYIFYEHYHAANADKAAYSELDYLNSNYSFFDENLNRHFEVYLDADIDMADIQTSAIGAESTTPFKGLFDGQGHTIINVNRGTEEGYIFGYMDGGKIANLRIESTHKVDLLKNATNGAYILGISMMADSKTNAIAQSLLGTSFVVGCIHVGDATGALVGEADNLYMYGSMQAAEGISGGALLGGYAASKTWNFFTPQSSKKVSWGRFMCNYYDKQLSPGAHAVGSITDAYKQLEYIRGSQSYILRAKNDNLISDEVPWDKLSANLKEAYYGLAPWKAMNYAIKRYNDSYGSTHKCTMHYEYNTIGYNHQYPVLKPGQCGTASDPTGLDYNKINPIEQNN